MQSMTIEQLRAATHAGGVAGVTLKGLGGAFFWEFNGDDTQATPGSLPHGASLTHFALRPGRRPRRKVPANAANSRPRRPRCDHAPAWPHHGDHKICPDLGRFRTRPRFSSQIGDT